MQTPAVRPAYRSDLEGLRGVAVLLVFAVHSLPQGLGGGFIGVDVFFVLSGFLISSITLAELDQGRFSMTGFYARRLRRLAPALLVVLLACLLFAALFAYPKDAREIGKHVLAGTAFVSNLALWREGGYFDTGAGMKPLLHLWSLGIEEQFYLLWPLAAMGLFRLRGRAIMWVAAAALASFALNVALVVDRPKATFFLPPTRFWELLVGVLLAYWSHATPGGPLAATRRLLPLASVWQRWLPDVFSACGLALLLSAIWVIDKTAHFPGWWALLPTGATFLLIAAGTQAWINRVVLSHPVLTFFGRISYPLYLWHWPLLTWPQLIDEPLSMTGHLFVLCASVVLAAATYYGLEKPFRFGRLARRAPLVLSLALMLAAAAGWQLWASDRLLQRYPESMRPIAQVHAHGDFDQYRVDRCFLRSVQSGEVFAQECVEPQKAASRLVLLWGDSHAAALYPGLRDTVRSDATGPRLAQFTTASCPPLLGLREYENRHCERNNDVVLKQVEAQRPSTVVLAAHWPRYAGPLGSDTVLAALARTMAALRLRGVADIIVVGPLPQWRVAPPRILLKLWAQGRPLPERSPAVVDDGALDLDRTLRTAARTAGARYVSPLDALCNAQGCVVSFQSDGRTHAIAFDDSHLTAAGSRLLWERMRPALGL